MKTIEQQRQQFFIKGLRRLSRFWPPANEALKDARVERGRYQCRMCKKIGPMTDIARDHINPVIDPKKGFTDWNDLIERLGCSKEGYQILCKDCHNKKTKSENEIRRAVKKAKKEKK